MKTGFIGAGSMGSAIIRGLAGKAGFSGAETRFFDASPDIRRDVSREFRIKAAAGNPELAEWADTIILAVKPGDVISVLSGIKDKLNIQKLLVSIAAGVDTKTIEEKAGRGIPVVRAMPNTPALIGLGMTALCAGSHARDEHMELAESLFSPIGEVARLEEEKMDAATAVSGSGPAYLFYLAEALEEAAACEGLSRETAEKLVRQTLYGASALLVRDKEGPEELRRRVSSPGGTTESAIKILEGGEFPGLIKKAVAGAKAKSIEIRNSISTSE